MVEEGTLGIYSLFFLMTKADLITAVARATGASKVKAEVVLQSVMGSVEKALKRDEKVRITRFGTFFLYNRTARVGVNPRTGERIQIPSLNYPVFKGSRILRDAIQ